MITLENKTLKLTIDEKGGQWTSLLDKMSQKEHLFQGNPDSWNRQAPLLFPIIGALKDDKYIYHGELYELGQHGFLRDLDLTIVSQSKKEVVLEATHTDETLKVYPFEFRLLITYKLGKNKVKTKVEITNCGQQTMYYNFGGHPGFIIDTSQENSLKVKGKKEIGQFKLDGKFVNDYEVIDQRSFNLSDIDLEATLVLDGVKEAIVETPTHDISLKMKPTRYMGFWAPRLAHSQEMEQVVCLEPWWGISDCVDHNQHLKDKKGILRLEPNQSQTLEFTIKITSKRQVPQAIGPYSISRETKDLIYLSGQLPLNPLTNQIETFDIASQTRQVLINVKEIINRHGYQLSDIIKTTVFLKNMDDFNLMNEVYGEFFQEPYPARSAIEVARLPKNALVEIEVIVEKEWRKK